MTEKKETMNTKNTLLRYNFDHRERLVFDYIRNNPGCNKQEVVEHFKIIHITGLSRNPIFKIIKSLINSGFIIEERHPHNRNTHKLFVNENNVILSVSDEMEDFKGKFLDVLNSLKPRLKKMDDNSKRKILYAIDLRYKQFVEIYMFRAILAFTKMINDKQTLDGLYKIIINNIITLQIKYHEFDNPQQSGSLAAIRFDEQICTDDDYENEIELFKSKGLEKQIMSMVQKLDGINYRYGKPSRVL